MPKALMGVRHFGFLANRCRREKLAIIRRAPGVSCAERQLGPTNIYPPLLRTSDKCR
jgi:hypothetical protein